MRDGEKVYIVHAVTLSRSTDETKQYLYKLQICHPVGCKIHILLMESAHDVHKKTVQEAGS